MKKIVQTIIVKKTPGMNLEKAKEKLKKAGGEFFKVDEKKGSYYFRQKDPNLFDKDSSLKLSIGKKKHIKIKLV